jgi:DNA topoisomerase-1
VSLPDKLPPDELTLAAALEMLDRADQAEQPLGVCPQTGKPVFVKIGRFGPYVQRGTAEDDEKPQNASLLKGMDPQQITLEMALGLLSLPRTLGDDPKTGRPVTAQNGRFGPYIKCGEETRSLPDGLSPLEITLDEALHLLAQPKSRRGAAARKEPLKVFEPSPTGGRPVRLMQGRYGPYVTDGTTNASLPRGMTPDELDFPFALKLLADRAAMQSVKGKPRKSTARRRPAKHKPKTGPRAGKTKTKTKPAGRKTSRKRAS